MGRIMNALYDPFAHRYAHSFLRENGVTLPNRAGATVTNSDVVQASLEGVLAGNTMQNRYGLPPTGKL